MVLMLVPTLCPSRQASEVSPGVCFSTEPLTLPLRHARCLGCLLEGEKLPSDGQRQQQTFKEEKRVMGGGGPRVRDPAPDHPEESILVLASQGCSYGIRKSTRRWQFMQVHPCNLDTEKTNSAMKMQELNRKQELQPGRP